MKPEQYDAIIDHLKRRFGTTNSYTFILDDGSNVIGQSSMIAPQVILVSDDSKKLTYIDLNRLIAITAVVA